MFSHRCFSSILLSSLVALPMAAQAAPRYSVTIVGVAGSTANGINNLGSVVGNFPFSATTTHGFASIAGVRTDLGTLGGTNSFANGINDSNDIVGASTLVDGTQRAFKYSAATMTDLGTMGGEESSAAAINNRGDIVGWSDIAPGDDRESRAFLLRTGVTMQDLGRFELPDITGGSVGQGLNEVRQVVGGSDTAPYTPPESPFHAFLYACEEMRDLGTFGGQFSMAYAINARGQIVGEADTTTYREKRAFLSYRGTLTNLGTLPGGTYSSARDINNRGQIVGYAASDDWVKAFLYEGKTMIDLNTLINPASGWTLTRADGINNGGQIAATGCRAGLCYALRLDPAK